MKKLFFSLVVAIVATTATYAQSTMVATLNHEGTVTVFHGATGFSEALTAAKHGDEITLSAGRFTAVNISKAVTIRGAGFEEDTVSITFPTVIVNDFWIDIPDSVTQKLTFEGVYCNSTIHIKGTLRNAMFQKCRFNGVSNDGTATYPCGIYNLTFANCRANSLDFRNASTHIATQVNCINSVIGYPKNHGGSSDWMEFTNCVVYGDNTSVPYNSIFHNCILYKNGGIYSFVLDSSNCAYYCVGYSGSIDNIFKNINNSSNTVNADLTNGRNAKMFKSGSYYELTDDAKAKYVGGDGTEVGIYGGNLPWNPNVLAPTITKCEVANKTTSDGKLSVNIEVRAAE